MTPGYPFRLYASPWKLGFFLAGTLTFATLGYWSLSRPASVLIHLLGWMMFILFGLAGMLFGVLFLFYIVVRRPLLEITDAEWRCRPLSFAWKVTSAAWREIARVGIYRLEIGRSVTYSLVIIPRSPELLEAQEGRTMSWYDPMVFSHAGLRVALTFAFLRVTPSRCERLLADIQTACASEIARYNVYVEPEVQRML